MAELNNLIVKGAGRVIGDLSALNFNGNPLKIARCTTAAKTAAKVATLSGFYLVHDMVIDIHFSNATGPVASPTLNVNNTGAKPIYIWYNGSLAIGSATRYLPAGIYRATYSSANNSWHLSGAREDLKTS